MQSLPSSPRQMANRPPLSITTQFASLRHSPTRPNRPHIQAPLQERRLGLKGALGPIPGRKGRKGPPRAAIGLGVSLAVFAWLFLLVVLGGRKGEGGEGSLDRDHKGAGAQAGLKAEVTAAAAAAAGHDEADEEGDAHGVFVAERIRHEHTQLRFGTQGGGQAGPTPTPLNAATEAAFPTEPLAPIATPVAEPAADDVQDASASAEPELVMLEEEEDHHDLAQLAEAAAMGEIAAEPANASTQDSKPKKMEMCERSLTFKLANLHGLGSEVALVLRAAAVARAYGYKNLFIDDSNWNFGKWTDYFEPLLNDCLPPPARKLTTSMQLSRDDLIALPRSPRYTRQPHIVWNNRDLDGLDQTFASLFIDRHELAALQARDRARLRPTKGAQVAFAAGAGAAGEAEGEELVPKAFGEAFRVQGEVMRDVWRPNGVVRRQMAELRAQMGLERGVRDGGEVHSGADEVVVAVHCRLGDKHKELGNLLPPSPTRRPNEVPGLHDELLDAFFGHAGKVVDRLLAEEGLPHADGWTGRPKLALMSDDAGALDAFVDHDLAGKWVVEGTEPKRAKRADAWKGRGGFSETFHNRLPLKKRVALARKFVRDLTLLAQETDGVVLTASSNVGRLMALLAGEEKAVVKGRVKSLDTRWFPLARFL